MGARAAVITMTERLTTTPKSGKPQVEGKLVLASYPLISPSNAVRDAILLAIPAGVSVLFISGDKDAMCPLPRLNEVRRKMNATSWLITVRGADHGVSLSPKDAVEKVREYIGLAAAKWVRGEGREEGKTECVVRWDAHGKKVVDEGWTKGENSTGGPFKAAARGKKEDKNMRGDQEQEEETIQAPPPSKRRKKA